MEEPHPIVQQIQQQEIIIMDKNQIISKFNEESLYGKGWS